MKTHVKEDVEDTYIDKEKSVFKPIVTDFQKLINKIEHKSGTKYFVTLVNEEKDKREKQFKHLRELVDKYHTIINNRHKQSDGKFKSVSRAQIENLEQKIFELECDLNVPTDVRAVKRWLEDRIKAKQKELNAKRLNHFRDIKQNVAEVQLPNYIYKCAKRICKNNERIEELNNNDRQPKVLQTINAAKVNELELENAEIKLQLKNKSNLIAKLTEEISSKRIFDERRDVETIKENILALEEKLKYVYDIIDDFKKCAKHRVGSVNGVSNCDL
ncbi:MAG: hypothetical protein MJ152_01030 [Clostridia bacterium]|nr:hypothetical protein [Clostridia bacterium]